MPHAGAPVIPADPQKQLFPATQVVMSYWTDSQEVEDQKPSQAGSLIHPTDTPQPHLHTQARKHDSLRCSWYLSMTGPEQ